MFFDIVLSIFKAPPTQNKCQKIITKAEEEEEEDSEVKKVRRRRRNDFHGALQAYSWKF